MQIYQMRSEWQRLHQLDEKIKKSGEDEWIQELLRHRGKVPGRDPSQNCRCQDYKIAIDAFQMIRVIRVLFWHQWQHEVQVVVDGIVSAASRVPIALHLGHEFCHVRLDGERLRWTVQGVLYICANGHVLDLFVPHRTTRSSDWVRVPGRCGRG
eukprot:s2667_g1.t1